MSAFQGSAGYSSFVFKSESNIDTSLLEGDEDSNPETRSLHKASWFSCYVNLTNTIMGAGMLGLPYAFSKTGWLLGMGLLILSALFSVSSLHLLSLACKRIRQPWSLYSLAEASLPSFSLFIDFSVALKCFGTATSYLIVVGDMMPEVMDYLGVAGFFAHRQTWVIISFIVVSPLSFLPSLHALRYTSSAALAFVFFVVILIAGYALGLDFADPCADIDASETCSGGKTWTNVPFSAMRALSIFVFGFTCHENSFAIINELKDPTQSRMDSVFMCSIGSALLVYCIVAICGYATYGDQLEPDILLNYPSNTITNMGRVFVSLLIIFSYPLQCNPGRQCMLNMIKSTAGGGTDPSRHVFWLRFHAVTILFLGGSFAIAFTVRDLGVMLEVVGATGSTLVSYILPGLIFVVMNYNLGSDVWEYKAAVLTLITGVFIMPLCLTLLFL